VRVFLAGAGGVIGRRLVLLLRRAGHDVVGTTRSQSRAAALGAIGATPAVVDAFDGAAMIRAVERAEPDIVIHQLTDLPDKLDPATLVEALARNARLRVEGTRNLIAAAKAADVRRVIAQSVAFVYAPGPEPHAESDPLATEGVAKVTVEGTTALEHTTLNTPGIDGVVLRYGRLYGPGTWTPVPNGRAPLHVDAAAHAALLALNRGRGIYNIAEEDGAVLIEKARRELEFDPDFRIRP
jgi:nucleoside-diphosphate-sugar epimerase